MALSATLFPDLIASALLFERQHGQTRLSTAIRAQIDAGRILQTSETVEAASFEVPPEHYARLQAVLTPIVPEKSIRGLSGFARLASLHAENPNSVAVAIANAPGVIQWGEGTATFFGAAETISPAFVDRYQAFLARLGEFSVRLDNQEQSRLLRSISRKQLPGVAIMPTVDGQFTAIFSTLDDRAAYLEARSKNNARTQREPRQNARQQEAQSSTGGAASTEQLGVEAGFLAARAAATPEAFVENLLS
ncbi:MAG: hypothetical protein ACYDA1_10345, partial [Vulcanimicrobiaceae bacterium]